MEPALETRPAADEYISMTEAARISGLSYYNLRRLYKEGRFPSAKREIEAGRNLETHLRRSGGGPVVLITRADLHEYLTSRTRGDRLIPEGYITPAGLPEPIWE